MKNALPSARSTMPRSARSGSGAGCSVADQGADVVVGQPAEVEPGDAGQPGPLGGGGAQRVPAVQVVAAVGRDDRDRGVEAAGEQEAEHLAGGPVGPVHVLDEEQQRRGPAEQLEGGVHGREQVGPVAGGRLSSAGSGCSGSTRRAGISRAMAGPASTSEWASVGESAASRPKASLNGR